MDAQAEAPNRRYAKEIRVTFAENAQIFKNTDGYTVEHSQQSSTTYPAGYYDRSDVFTGKKYRYVKFSLQQFNTSAITDTSFWYPGFQCDVYVDGQLQTTPNTSRIHSSSHSSSYNNSTLGGSEWIPNITDVLPWVILDLGDPKNVTGFRGEPRGGTGSSSTLTDHTSAVEVLFSNNISDLNQVFSPPTMTEFTLPTRTLTDYTPSVGDNSDFNITTSNGEYCNRTAFTRSARFVKFSIDSYSVYPSMQFDVFIEDSYGTIVLNNTIEKDRYYSSCRDVSDYVHHSDTMINSIQGIFGPNLTNYEWGIIDLGSIKTIRGAVIRPNPLNTSYHVDTLTLSFTNYYPISIFSQSLKYYEEYTGRILQRNLNQI